MCKRNILIPCDDFKIHQIMLSLREKSHFSVSRSDIFEWSHDWSTIQLSKLTGQISVKPMLPIPHPNLAWRWHQNLRLLAKPSDTLQFAFGVLKVSQGYLEKSIELPLPDGHCIAFPLRSSNLPHACQFAMVIALSPMTSSYSIPFHVYKKSLLLLQPQWDLKEQT